MNHYNIMTWWYFCYWTGWHSWYRSLLSDCVCMLVIKTLWKYIRVSNSFDRNITLEDPNTTKPKNKSIVAKGIAKVKGSASATGNKIINKVLLLKNDWIVLVFHVEVRGFIYWINISVYPVVCSWIWDQQLYSTYSNTQWKLEQRVVSTSIAWVRKLSVLIKHNIAKPCLF